MSVEKKILHAQICPVGTTPRKSEFNFNHYIISIKLNVRQEQILIKMKIAVLNIYSKQLLYM